MDPHGKAGQGCGALGLLLTVYTNVAMITDRECEVLGSFRRTRL
ncbi:hypothetical protein [Anaerostipes sp.]|nr:hypothetical protein [Anaerostipes sp.]